MPLKPEVAFLLLAFSLLATAAIAAEEMGGYTIDVATNETLGSYLVNDTGFTLYYFMHDAPGNGTSTCYGKCAGIWPSFYEENVTVPEGLNASDFTTVMRTDGKEQTAFMGWPLYFYSKDTEPGDVRGQGINNIWFVVNPKEFPPMKS